MSSGYVDVGVAWVFADDVENCVISPSDIISRYRRRLQLLLEGDQNAYDGDQKEGHPGEHGRLRASNETSNAAVKGSIHRSNQKV